MNWGLSAAGLAYMGYTIQDVANSKGIAFNNDTNHAKHYGGFTSTKTSATSVTPAVYSTTSGWGFGAAYVVAYSGRGINITDAMTPSSAT